MRALKKSSVSPTNYVQWRNNLGHNDLDSRAPFNEGVLGLALWHLPRTAHPSPAVGNASCLPSTLPENHFYSNERGTPTARSPHYSPSEPTMSSRAHALHTKPHELNSTSVSIAHATCRTSRGPFLPVTSHTRRHATVATLPSRRNASHASPCGPGDRSGGSRPGK